MKKKYVVSIEGREECVFVTDEPSEARQLREDGEAVVIWLHEGNRDVDFSGFLYAVEDPENLEADYIDRVFRRSKHLPWSILETERLFVRETTEDDVDAFYEIYRNPAITEYMEGLFPEVEDEKQYVRDYIEKIYTYYEYGVWTVIEKASGAVIGRAGLSARDGYAEPELGFVIGVPWQRQGYAEEVCRAILKFGKEELGFETFQVLVEPENAASLELCRKLGFHGDERVYLNEIEHVRMLLEYTEI